MATKKGWALILGGSSGLGLATAKKLAREGYDLFIVHRDRRADMPRVLAEFDAIGQSGQKVRSFNADATNAEKRTAVVAEMRDHLKGEGIKVLVHSIAKGSLKPMVSEEGASLNQPDFNITLNAMALSIHDWTKALMQNDLFSKDVRIISFTSEGSGKAWPGYAAVSAAKATLEALTRSMAVELAPYGIKANCIQAGMTDTPSFQKIPGSDQLHKATLKRNPNGRLTRPEDVANAVYLLTTPEAKWITGNIIKVDGGESLR